MVVSWRLVLLHGVARTLLATVVIALAADLLTAKCRLATMASAMNPLSDGPLNKVLTSGPAGQSDNILSGLLDNWLLIMILLVLALILLAREARALLAPPVTTAQTSRISTVAGVALVALAMDAHPDLLMDTFDGARSSLSPLRRDELETMLLEKSLSTLCRSLNWGRWPGRWTTAGARDSRSRLGCVDGSGGNRFNWRR